MPPLRPTPEGGPPPATDPWWRTLDEAEGRAAPPAPDVPPDGGLDRVSRRGFLKLAALASASAGIAACSRQPTGPLLPYTRRPTGLTPGVPLHFATSVEAGSGWAVGLLVQSWEGRPVKVEGNPLHPASLGATGLVHQALPHQLYDSGRASEVLQRGQPASWQAFVQWLGAREPGLAARRGAGLRFLLEPTSSPLVADLRDRILERHPLARFHYFGPAGAAGPGEAARLVFGKDLTPRLELEPASVIVSLDADFADRGPFRLRYARQLADHRVPEAGMSRLYCLEPTLTATGTLADHRLRVRPSEVETFALALLERLADLPEGTRLSPLRPLARARPRVERLERWAQVVAKDLAKAGSGRSLVVAGDGQPAVVHALAIAINAALGNLGKTLIVAGPALLGPAGPAVPPELLEEMRAGQVDTLYVDAFNPVYSAPADAGFAQALAKVPHSIYRALYSDETARAAGWFLPATHPFEAWGDALAPDGTLSTAQPLIAPLFNGRSREEVLALFLGQGPAAGPGFELLLDSWRRHPPAQGPVEWDRWISAGVVPGTALPAAASAAASDVPWDRLAGRLAPLLRPAAGAGGPAGLELHLIPSRRVHDGRFLNVAWLLELPEPMSKVSWDNAAFVSPATAHRLGLSSGEVARLSLRGRSVEAPVSVLPGQADEVVTLELGWGWQVPEGSAARGVGFNAYALRFADSPWFAAGLSVEKAGRRHRLASTQHHFDMHGRPLALSVTLDEVRQGRLEEVARYRGPQPRLYQPFSYEEGHRWAMAIDLSRCTGCSACVMACVAENNSPVVGRHGVQMGREMSWLRVDRYYRGPAEDPEEVLNQPMACVHCEYAPCEYVCPVNATVHGDEGLNQMVYNRCIGTRYCSNNCPYKVRRFNFLAYTGRKTPVERMVWNPDVTVRSRGVMEKCTYCIQRIERARIGARVEGRPLPPDAVQTACQQACPTRAIVFGDLNQPADRVVALHRDGRRYDVLHEVGTRPRTGHLARVRNPNPELG